MFNVLKKEIKITKENIDVLIDLKYHIYESFIKNVIFLLENKKWKYGYDTIYIKVGRIKISFNPDEQYDGAKISPTFYLKINNKHVVFPKKNENDLWKKMNILAEKKYKETKKEEIDFLIKKKIFKLQMPIMKLMQKVNKKINMNKEVS